MTNYRNTPLHATVECARAAGDPSRLRMLAALLHAGELCACQLTDLLDLAPSTVSKHLSILYQAGLVDSRREGRWVHFSIPAETGRSPQVGAMLACLKQALTDDPTLEIDRKRIAAIVEKGLENVCRTTSNPEKAKVKLKP